MIVVIDYGRGNLYSLSQALDHVGAAHCVSDDAAAIGAADGVILPGVGAFGDSMDAVRARGLVEPLCEIAAAGTPVLGICLGMQILATTGEEFGSHHGLGLVPGEVRRLPAPASDDPEAVRIPNVGWRRLEPRQENFLMQKLPSGAMMYFVHSYGFFPQSSSDVVATARVNGLDVPAIVRRGGVSGCQFHPERSGEAGLTLLENFARLVAGRTVSEQARSIGGG